MPAWRQLHELPSLFQRGNRYAVSTTLAFAMVCGYALQWVCSFWGAGHVEAWLGLSQAGLQGGCLWQLFTYPFLGDLQNPLVSLVIVAGLMMIGRELENLIGPREVSILFFSATILSGATAALPSARSEILGAWPAVFALTVACTEALSEYQLSYRRVVVRYRFLGATLMAILFTCWLLNWFPFGYASVRANLIGAGIGWVYVRFLGFGRQLPSETIVRSWLIKRRYIERMPARRYISEFVDPVLDKIQTEGVHRLTGSERRILRKARQKARRTLL